MTRLIQIIFEKILCRKHLKIKILDERKECKKRLRKMPMPNKNWTENAGKKTVGYGKCFEGVAQQSQRDWPNSGFLFLLVLLKRGSQLEKRTLMY